jgi:hypothetical protein
MGSGKDKKTKFQKKTAFLKNRTGAFSLRVKSLNNIIITCTLLTSLTLRIPGLKGRKNSIMRVLTFKETVQKGVCDKEYP